MRLTWNSRLPVSRSRPVSAASDSAPGCSAVSSWTSTRCPSSGPPPGPRRRRAAASRSATTSTGASTSTCVARAAARAGGGCAAGGDATPGVGAGPRDDAAQQADEQQQVDRGEPRRGVDVEEAEPVQPLPRAGVLGEVGPDGAGVDAALREQRAGHGRHRQEQEQDERRPHARQLPPQPAGGPAGPERRPGPGGRAPRAAPGRVRVGALTAAPGTG